MPGAGKKRVRADRHAARGNANNNAGPSTQDRGNTNNNAGSSTQARRNTNNNVGPSTQARGNANNNVGPSNQAPPRVAQAPAQPATGYDGPNDPEGSRGRAGSTAPTAPSVSSASRPASQVRSGSQARAASQNRGPPNQEQAQASKDTPKKDPAQPQSQGPLLRNVDFGGGAYNVRGDNSQMPTQLMQRGKYGTLGKIAEIEINSHVVTAWPRMDVFQYDIQIGSGTEKRGLVKAVWESQAVRAIVGKKMFIFDGNHIGWSPHNIADKTIDVDLDSERNRPTRAGALPNIHKFRIKKAKNQYVRMEALRAYLDGKADFNNSVLEAINFIDHILREMPSRRLINLKRSYFSRVANSTERTLIGGGIEAMKGVYQTIRAAEGKRLVINVDVSNSCFWHEAKFDHLAYLISGRGDQQAFMADATIKGPHREPPLWPALRRLHKNKFYVKHKGWEVQKEFTLKCISDKNAKTHKFDVRDRATGTVKETSVFDYFLQKYNVHLYKWALPLLVTTRKDVLMPMEISYMMPGQRYPFKLNESQTTQMIKFAVTRPAVRRAAIEHGLSMLDWAGDPVLKDYGLKIEGRMLKTKARILPPPEVQFKGTQTAKPGFGGKWDLKHKTFWKPNYAPLTSWGVCILPRHEDMRNPITIEQVRKFLKIFLDTYRALGGEVKNANPPITQGVPDDADAIMDCFLKAGEQFDARPQMMLIIMANKSSEVYHRVKRSCDCRFGIMSQCVQASNVLKCNPQYCANVLMKFNCKLGGTTSFLKSHMAYRFFNGPTMIIGADVSHAAPGAPSSSMAAMTVSLDKTASRYGASVQTNGHRVEMITTSNVEEMLTPLLDWWMKNVGGGRPPQHVYYFRDGVSEGQYVALLKNEVADMKRLFAKMGQHHPDNMPKFTVVVAEKRHHIRFFPPKVLNVADGNGNPVPGTLVDRDVTHPFENDVYLCSHAAIQGTARPTHYHMLMDEAKVPPDYFQSMLYEHCYQYQRATTPVSLFPAVYYAHLASKRAEGHVDKKMEVIAAENRIKRKLPGVHFTSSDDSEAEAPKLKEFQKTNQIHLGMWYI